MASELERAEAAIRRVAGVNPRPLFRPPYGEWSSALLDVAAAEGYPYTILWNVDTRDWEGRSAEIIRQHIVSHAAPGAIVLMHGRPASTPVATRLAVGDLRVRGYQFVTISELLSSEVRARRDFGGDSYTVQPGDSWAYIGACHNVTGDRVRAYNDLPEARDPSLGAALKIPHSDEVIIRVDEERPAFTAYPRLTPSGWVMAEVGLAGELGAELERDGGQVRLRAGSKQIAITPGSRMALVNGIPVDMAVEPLELDGQLLVSAEFLAAQTGASVRWDSATRTLHIARPVPPVAQPPAASPKPAGHGSTRVN